jgi:hypothetical protein
MTNGSKFNLSETTRTDSNPEDRIVLPYAGRDNDGWNVNVIPEPSVIEKMIPDPTD